MNTHKPLILLCCLFCLGAAPRLCAQEQTPPDANSISVNASVLLQINGYPTYRNPDQWVDLLNTITQETASQHLQMPAAFKFASGTRTNYFIRFEPIFVSEREITGKLAVVISNPELPPIADEIRAEIIARIERFLRTDYETNKQVLSERSNTLQKLVEQVQVELKGLEVRTLEITGGRQMDEVSLRVTVTQLSQERDEAAFQLRSMEGRIRNLHARMGDAREKEKKASAEDEILHQLQQKVDLLQQQLERLKTQQQAGTISASEITEAQQRLIDARIELAHRREVLQSGPEAQKARETEELITDLGMEMSEQQMRINFLEEQIAQARHMLERSTEYDMLRIQIDTRKKTLHDSMQELEDIRSTLATLQTPQVAVLSQ